MKRLKWLTLALSLLTLFILGNTFPSAKVSGEDIEQSSGLLSTTGDTQTNDSNTQTSSSQTSTSQTSGSQTSSSQTQDTSTSGDPDDKSKDLIVEEVNPPQYLTFKKLDPTIWKTVNGEVNDSVSIKDKEVFITKNKITDQESTVYYSVYSLADVLIGYAKADDVTVIGDLSDRVKPFNKYVTITQSGATVYSDLVGTEASETAIAYRHTYLAKEKATAINGEVLLSLYDAKNQFLGYINIEVVTSAKGPQGVHQAQNKYVTISNKKYNTWSSFDWKKRSHTSKLFGKTFKVKGVYQHINGSAYYSLFDGADKWHGYINQKAVQETSGPEGTPQTIGKYVTITNKNYSSWNNFKWQERYKGQKLVNRTFKAKGLYHHVNGLTYYSLYDTNDKWYGFINTKASKTVAQAQGDYQTFEKYVTITKKNYGIWDNFSWKKKNETNKVVGKTYLAKGLYRHANGGTYYSLYDNQGKWQGYLNSDAAKVAAGPQGVYQAYNKYVTITTKKYNFWTNFKWEKKDTSSNHLGETYLVKGLYRHANGSVYYSLYDSQGKWYGYAKKGVGKLATGPEGVYQSFGKKVVITSKDYPVWSNFNWKEKSQSSKLYGKTFTARVVYHHANGSSYYSLYNTKGQWTGYINQTATTLE